MPAADVRPFPKNVGGVYFLAEDTIVSGDSAQGAYNDGANNPTIIEWTLDKTQ